MRGLTRMLEERIFSGASLPAITRRATAPRADRRWRGKNAGRRRGMAIDAQLTSIANARSSSRPKRLYRLTKTALGILSTQRIALVRGQQPVICEASNIASAVDLVGLRNATELVLIEVKTGYDEGRLVAAMANGMPQKMHSPLSRASDCLMHRHLAQLSATSAMFVSNDALMKQLEEAGVRTVTGMLIYVSDQDVEVVELMEWWSVRGSALLRALG